ncbi:MAG: amino acid ABC transporter permease [Anaerolineae bacterium]|nr:amino acid ABC transporter permease [Anaerolineae bacterium]
MVLDRLRPGTLSPKATSGRIATWMWFVGPVLMFILVYGLGNILPLTDTRRWGGLLLTIMLSAVGIIASFPIGILLALGRRSSLPIISLLSTLYIEFVRGVPLITVLFMAQLLVPLVNPTLAETPNVFRAMVGIILFSAAYLAENVRGGLQSIPPGQEEAAKALGLSGIQITLQITLPQALRAVLPALVGQFISLFKDTSLVAIVGLLDFSAMGELVVAQTEFLGLRREVYVFLIVFYFAFCYAIASISRRIESSGAGKALARKI